MFDYRVKPRSSDVLVRIVREGGGDIRPQEVILDDLARLGSITVEPAGLDDPPPTGDFLLRHIIVLSSQGFDIGLVRRARGVALQWKASLSLAFRYESQSEMLSHEPLIDTLKIEFGDDVNFLRPDRDDDGWYVSREKVLDNAICDTLRVKYRPVPDLSAGTVTLSDAEHRYFQGCCNLYVRHHLFLRSMSDGYIALRRQDGFLITATKTRKDRFRPDRVSLVRRYDEVANTIYYEGTYLPSSDSVEAAIVFQSRPDLVAIFHTHASARFTRNPAYRCFRTVGQLPYGEPALGRAIVGAVAGSESGLCVMEEHGEIFYTRASPLDLLAFVDRACTDRSYLLRDPVRYGGSALQGRDRVDVLVDATDGPVEIATERELPARGVEEELAGGVRVCGAWIEG